MSQTTMSNMSWESTLYLYGKSSKLINNKIPHYSEQIVYNLLFKIRSTQVATSFGHATTIPT